MKDVPAGGERLQISLAGHVMEFLQFPIDVIPPEGTTGIVQGEGWRTAGKFRDGAWRRINGTNLSRTPTHWIAWEDRRG